MSILRHTYRILLALMIPTLLLTTSCGAFHEDLQPCPQGLRLRFVYDYHLEGGNAFPAQVDCLTLLVYDKDGNYVRTVTAGRAQTSDEDWRMIIDLPEGDYQLLAYGGMDCEKSSFRFNESPSLQPIEDLQVYLEPSQIGKDLHPLFWGMEKVTVPPVTPNSDYTNATVYMMKDTNELRILLGNENGTPNDADDFIFTIVDNNTRFNYLNNIISKDNITYTPWDQGNIDASMTINDDPATVTFAEFTISRLMQNSDATLYIKHKDGRQAVKMKLITILLMYKSSRLKDMPAQEYLDRESRWRLGFFLPENGVWAGVSVVVNGWIVRLNDNIDL